MFESEENPPHLHLEFAAESRRPIKALYRAALARVAKRNA